MPTNRIPERQPAGDAFQGFVIRMGSNHILAATPPGDLPPDGSQTVASGDFVVRYGIRYLGKPFLSIVPGLLALDYGDMLTGEDALQFVLAKGERHPRADVVGYRNDGTDEMINVKLLDLALPVDVLVYRDAAAVKPLASVEALIGPVTAALPPLMQKHLPRYDTVSAWRSGEAPTPSTRTTEEGTDDEQ